MNLKNFFNNEKVILFLIIIISLLVRIPFLQDNIEYNKDSIIYGANIEKPFFSGKYDVHPPGYILYIYSGKIFYIFVKNTTLIQHILNICFIILINISFFFLLRKLNFTKLENFLFNLMLSFNTVLLLSSSVGGNRLILILSSILLIYFAFEIIVNNNMNKIIIFSFLFGILSGFRQDLSYIFLPLFLFLLYKVKNFYLIIKSIIMFGLICLIWFIPLIIEYGGISSYLYILKNQKCVYETSLIIKGISLRPLINILRVLFYIFNSLFFVFPIFIYKIYKNDNLNIEKKFLIILLFSLIPALIFNLFIHMGNYTLIGSFIIPLFIYLIYNFKINNLKKIIFIIILTLFPLIQFYNIKLIKEPKNIIEKVINVIFLQYSFDGIKSKNELALQSIYIPERK